MFEGDATGDLLKNWNTRNANCFDVQKFFETQNLKLRLSNKKSQNVISNASDGQLAKWKGWSFQNSWNVWSASVGYTV